MDCGVEGYGGEKLFAMDVWRVGDAGTDVGGAGAAGVVGLRSYLIEKKEQYVLYLLSHRLTN